MTIVFWDGKNLYADRLASSSSFKYNTTKIGKLKDGSLFGVAGDEHANAIVSWLNGDRNPDNYPSSGSNDKSKDTSTSPDSTGGEVMVIEKKSHLIKVYSYSAFPDIIEEFYWGIGTGRESALAFSQVLKEYRGYVDGEEVVRRTIIENPVCGGGIDRISFSDKRPQRVVDVSLAFNHF